MLESVRNFIREAYENEAKSSLWKTEKVQRTVDKYNRNLAKQSALFTAEQTRQGKKADEPIDLMQMFFKKKE